MERMKEDGNEGDAENGQDIIQGSAAAETASRTTLDEQSEKHSFRTPGRMTQGDYHI
jgi:hypothetical protein